MHWTTGTLARDQGCASETIRNYERAGVVNPTRDQAGRRLFTDEDRKRIQEYRRKLHEDAR